MNLSFAWSAFYLDMRKNAWLILPDVQFIFGVSSLNLGHIPLDYFQLNPAIRKNSPQRSDRQGRFAISGFTPHE